MNCAGCASRAARGRWATRSASPTAASGSVMACTSRSGARCGTARRCCSTAHGRVSLRGLSQPRLEPEVVFGFARSPRAGMSLAELQGCLDWVAHGFEIVHTHFEGWRFTAADTVADFALHGRLCVGPRVPVQGWATLAEDLAALRVELLCDGRVVDSGQGAVVLDGPLNALRLWVDAMAEHTPGWPVAARRRGHHRHDHRCLAAATWADLEHAAERCASCGADAAHRGLTALHYNPLLRFRPTRIEPGEVAEWSNVPDSKSGVGASLPWVRIPPSPPASLMDTGSLIRSTRQKSL